MNRKLSMQIRADAMAHGALLAGHDLQAEIVARKLRIQELEEELKYHQANLTGYLAVASMKKQITISRTDIEKAK